MLSILNASTHAVYLIVHSNKAAVVSRFQWIIITHEIITHTADCWCQSRLFVRVLKISCFGNNTDVGKLKWMERPFDF